MDYRFVDLVDIEAFRNLLKSLYEATGILHGLVDDENNVISAAGWQEACSDFHRTFPISNERCQASNRYLSEHLHDGAFVGCMCENGLMDYATPIMIEGRQVATLYFGQILHEPPDMEHFRRQARECGFDEEAYLAAIREVPVIPRERVEPIMAFFSQLAQVLARSGLDRLHQQEAEQRLAALNRDLTFLVDERTAELAEKNALLAADIALRQRTEQELRENRAQLQAILDSSPIGIGWSRHGKIEYVNRTFTELFGYRLDEIATSDQLNRLAFPDERFRKEVVDRWSREIAASKDSGMPAPTLEAPVVCKDGTIRYGLIQVSWIGDRRLVNFSDITDRWRAERRNSARKAILELIASGASLDETLNTLILSLEEEDRDMRCSILLLDADGRRLHTGAAPHLPEFYNEAIDGLEIGDGVGSCGTAAFKRKRVIVDDIQHHPYWANFRDLASRANLAACWSEPILSSTGRLLGTFAIYHREPNEPDEEDLNMIGQAANLASIAIEHHQALDLLEHQAQTDYLTGLANRRHFLEQAKAELARSARYGGSVSLLMFDIDHFKQVNDRHGHETGDIVLQALASIVRLTLRETDMIGRIGGEEFVALLPETQAQKASEVAERLRTTVAEAAIPTGQDNLLHITISIGIATSRGDTDSLKTLLQRADIALYEAKHGGRNIVRISGAA